MMNAVRVTVAVQLVLLLVIEFCANSALGTVITVHPEPGNREIFEQGNFRRTCRYGGNDESIIEEFQILHNNSVIQTTSTDAVMLDISRAELSDSGLYQCRIVFTNGTVTGKVAIGTLFVIDLRLVIAPSDQYVQQGMNITPQCEFDSSTSAITTIRHGQHTVETITNADIEDEGVYECDVTLISSLEAARVPFTLHVFVPINITSYPSITQTFTSIQRVNFSITFTGREAQDIRVVWHREGQDIESSEHAQITTTFPEPTQGVTSILFPAIACRDSGVYRVVITANAIPDESLREDFVSFQVVVSIYPPDPVNFRASVAEYHADLTWELPITHPDEAPNTIQLSLFLSNGLLLAKKTLNGTARNTTVTVSPGVSYQARLVTINENGEGESEILNFTTHPAAPSIDYFEPRRINATHFNVSIGLKSTGGGDLTTFEIRARVIDEDWPDRPVAVYQIQSLPLRLEFHEIVFLGTLQERGPLEFELVVENGVGFIERKGQVKEKSDPPGLPTVPVVINPSDTSVTIDFQLPQEGTPPFISVVIDFSGPQDFSRDFPGQYQPGREFRQEIKGLTPNTAYTLKAKAVNYAGDGPNSQTISFTTAESPEEDPTSAFMRDLLPAFVAGGISFIALLAVKISIICFAVYHCKRRKLVKTYRLDKGNEEKVDEQELTGKIIQRKPSSEISVPPSKDSLDTLERKTETSGSSSVSQQRESDLPSITSSSQSSSKKWNLESNTRNDNSSITSSSIVQQSQDSFRKQDLMNQRREIDSPSITSSREKWRMENSSQRNDNCSINSGSAVHQSQDSFKKQEMKFFSQESSDMYFSLQSSQQGYFSSRPSKENISNYRRIKLANPSISSGCSDGTDMTGRNPTQSSSCLSPQTEETYSFTSMPFIPEGSHYSEESSLPYTCSYDPQSQYVSDV